MRFLLRQDRNSLFARCVDLGALWPCSIKCAGPVAAILGSYLYCGEIFYAFLMHAILLLHFFGTISMRFLVHAPGLHPVCG